jgi:thioredoxin reductase
VGAIEIGLGELAARPDMPRLSEELETTVPGIFVAGELGGIALIRNAVEQGIRAVEAMARRSRAAMGNDPELLIVGAGPSGLAASLQAIESDLSHVTIDQADLGGTVRTYPRRKLVLTQPVKLPMGERLRRQEYRKEDLIEQWEAILKRRGVSIRSGVKLLGVDRRDGGFETKTSAGTIRSRFVLLALGRRGIPRKLGVPGEESGKVFYRLIDAASYRDMRLLVVGGGDSAVEAATALASQPGNEVTLSYRKPAFFRLKKRNL